MSRGIGSTSGGANSVNSNLRHQIRARQVRSDANGKPAVLHPTGKRHREAIIDAAAAAPQLSPRRRHAFQRFGIDNFSK